MQSQETAKTALQKLIDEPKGKTSYTGGEAFLLHVFWECPSADVAHQLLDALNKCALATYRDTPCVPTYFFRVSTSDDGLYGEAPVLVGEHKQLAAAIKKLQVGVSRAAVTADLVKRGLDPRYLDLDLSAPLPEPLQHQRPVAVEFTEVYLDERAFMEHAGSKDYLKAYGLVMSPALMNRPPTTLRFGTPRASMIEKILEPVLKEVVMPLLPGCSVWRDQPKHVADTALLLSVDVNRSQTAMLSETLKSETVWCVCYDHPFREGITRWMMVFADVPSNAAWRDLASLNVIRGEIQTKSKTPQTTHTVQSAMDAHGLSTIQINAGEAVGYLLHDKSAALTAEP